MFQQVTAKFQLQNFHPCLDGLGVGLLVAAGLNSLLNSLLNSFLNSLPLLNKSSASLTTLRASFRLGGRGVLWAL